METESLRAFALVFRMKSFAAAARELQIAPSSVSRMMASLEEELGLRLFQRSTRKLTATEAGHIYFEKIAPLIEDLDNARNMALDVSDEPAGLLRVSAPMIFIQRRIVPILPDLGRKYPKLSYEFITENGQRDMVAEGIDVSVRIGKLRDSSLVAKKLFSLVWAAMASPKYLAERGTPETPADLIDHDVLLFPHKGHPNRLRFRDESGCIEAIDLKPRYIIPSTEGLIHCARMGMGITLVPRWFADPNVKMNPMVDLWPNLEATQTDFDTAIWIVHPSREYVPLKVRVFIDAFDTLFKALAAKRKG